MRMMGKREGDGGGRREEEKGWRLDEMEEAEKKKRKN